MAPFLMAEASKPFPNPPLQPCQREAEEVAFSAMRMAGGGFLALTTLTSVVLMILDLASAVGTA